MKVVLADGTALGASDEHPGAAEESFVPTGGRMDRAVDRALQAIDALPASDVGMLIAQVAQEIESGMRDGLGPGREHVGFEIEFGLTFGGQIGLEFASCKSEGSFLVRLQFLGPAEPLT